MKTVVIVKEIDLSDMDKRIIAVATSIDKAEELINEYYGNHKVLSHRDIREGNLEYEKVLEVKYVKDIYYQVKVILEWFNIDEL